ncbi:MAG: A/G-specific adenine glycosylase [Desulfovibrio fairfieldensis]
MPGTKKIPPKQPAARPGAAPAMLPGLEAAPRPAPPRHLPPDAHLPQLREALLAWFAAHQRPLPWRINYTPYEVWISEVMLQQTQMERGVSYFTRWMARFPDVAALAAASEEEVLRLWEGLGYYSRARHVLAAARLIMEKHKGVFPSGLEDIRALPGVGPYTAGAVSTSPLAKSCPAWTPMWNGGGPRLRSGRSVKQEPAASAMRAWLRLVPEGGAREHNQAMMELGALVCGKKPRCALCPLAAFCVSLHLGIVDQRPVPGKRAAITPIEVVTGVLRHTGRVFVQKRLASGVWGNLWEFPGGRVEPGESPEQAVAREFGEETGFDVAVDRSYGIIRHGYTTYRITLHCFALSLAATTAAATAAEPPAPPILTAASAWRWVTPVELENLAMPAAHRKLADQIFGPGGQSRLPGA